MRRRKHEQFNRIGMKNRPGSGFPGRRADYFTRIVFVVVLVLCPLLTVVRTCTLPELVVLAVELIRTLMVLAIAHSSFQIGFFKTPHVV